MKKKLLTVILALVASLCLCFGLAACGGGSVAGTYYLIENDEYDMQTYFVLKGGKWSDEDGASGEYEINGEKITFYTDLFGERVELTDGTLKDGILTVRDPDGERVFAKEGAWSGASSNPNNGGNSGNGGNGGDTTGPSGGGSNNGSNGTQNGGTQTGPNGGEQTPKEYTVTYDANGGAFSDGKNTKSVTVKENEKLSEPEEPKRDKYTFVYWCTDSSLDEEWDFEEDTVTKTTTLWAKWETAIVEHDVTYILNYEGAQDIVKPTEDGLVTYIPERTDYVFNGWWLSDGQTESGEYILAQKWDTTAKVTEDGLILVAEWVEKSTVSSQLPAPSVTISENVFTWQEVPGAVSYDVRVYESNSRVEKTKETVQGTSWTFPSGYEAGYYTVKIRAMGNGETTVNSSYVSKSYGHLILGSISKIDFDITTSVLTWTAVGNAASYDLYVDGAQVDTLTYTTYDLSGYEAGEHSIKIIAKRDGYQSSTANKTINKLRLKTPTVTITPDENRINYTVSWESVLHADTYIVIVNGEEHRVADTSYTFDRTSASWGDIEEISVTVAAFDSDADYLKSNPSEEQTVKRAYLLTVTTSDEAAGSVSTERAGYVPDAQVTLTASTNMGYTLVGWYKGDNEVSKELTYQFIMGKENVTLEARWQYVDGMEKFIFTATPTSCEITGLKDESATDITIPDCVTVIGNSAFSGCSLLTSIVIPDGVTEIGWYAFNGCSSLTSINIPNGVTSIGERAFYKCSSLTSITIPDGVTSIGDRAFYKCSSLTSITIPNSVTSIGKYAFYYCSSLTSIMIPQGVTSIGEDAFNGCSSLTSIVIPDSVTSIGNYAFWDCSSLTSITIPDSVTSIGKYAFNGCSSLTSIMIPQGVTSIGEKAFEDCYKLVEVWNYSDLPIRKNDDSYGYVAYYAKQVYTTDVKSKQTVTDDGYIFYENGEEAYLIGYKGDETSLTLPSKSPSGKDYAIYRYAFYDCSSLTSITIPDGVTSIGERAFYFCSSLKSITIPDGVTSIGKYAFYGCESLTSITIPFVGATKDGSLNTHFGYIFGASSYSVNSEYVPASLKTVVITGGTSIGNSAFSYCSSLTSITIPDSVTSIGYEAFRNCSSLTSITIPFVGATKDGSLNTHFGYIFGASSYSVNSEYVPASLKTVVITGGTSIGNSAFCYCSSLTSITIPDSVTSIGDEAFWDCSSLTSITIPDSVTSIGGCAFYYCTNLTDIQFKGTVAEWQAIEKVSSWNYNTGEYTVTCTDGTVKKDGTVTKN